MNKIWRFLSGRRSSKGVRLHNGPDTIQPPKGTVECNIVLLDGTAMKIHIPKRAPAQELIDQVAHALDLVEKDYFGLQFSDVYQVSHWLDPTKTVKHQIKIGPPFTLHFRVKLFPPNPQNIREELTRYYFFLQIKQDIQTGRLPCPFDVAVELAAYILQSENGDYAPNIHTPEFVSEYRFVPEEQQTDEMENSIIEMYKKQEGRTPANVEFTYLLKAKNLELYGVDVHVVFSTKDHQEYSLGLTPNGILVRDKEGELLGNFNWDKTEHINLDGKKLRLWVYDDEHRDSYPFVFMSSSKKAAKHLWKCAVEHNTFFRTTAPLHPPTIRQNFFRMGSRFRHTGKTAAQMATEARPVQKAQFERRPSQRYSRRSTIRRAPAATTNSGTSHVNTTAATATENAWSLKSVPTSPTGTSEILASRTISPQSPPKTSVQNLAAVPQFPMAESSCEVLATTFLSMSDCPPPLPPRLGGNERSPSLSEIANRDLIRSSSARTLVASPVESTGLNKPADPPSSSDSPLKSTKPYHFTFTPAALPLESQVAPLLPSKSEEFRRSRGALDNTFTTTSTLPTAPTTVTTSYTTSFDQPIPREINGFRLKSAETVITKDPTTPKELISILKKDVEVPSLATNRHPSSDSGRASPPSDPSVSPSRTSSALSAVSKSLMDMGVMGDIDTAPLLRDFENDHDEAEALPTPLLAYEVAVREGLQTQEPESNTPLAAFPNYITLACHSETAALLDNMHLAPQVTASFTSTAVVSFGVAADALLDHGTNSGLLLRFGKKCQSWISFQT
ncbi:hypothetical protein RvY_13119-2 [Ramazzottius varieornatus]|uniref:FERM domain-containing protein n=1 Tax=Ramazzottius varieornatus TaxID=947166 RepID=A0A1D1VLU4_RAMVA|nr:hypothetical protein RvY_13119-2 [Ramazzottius varieornatus]